jgi:cold-inducible RNA-binding protein
VNNNRLFVGSLSYNVTSEQVEELFNTVGKVVSAKVIMDRDTGRSKGFAFVEMSSPEEAKQAMTLDGTQLDGRAISVKEARPQEAR